MAAKATSSISKSELKQILDRMIDDAERDLELFSGIESSRLISRIQTIRDIEKDIL